MTLGTTVGPPADLDEHRAALVARQRWAAVLDALVQAPAAGVDDLAAAVARVPSRSTSLRQDEVWDPAGGMGTADGRSFMLTVGLGGARVVCMDRARSERVLERLRSRQEREATLRASVVCDPGGDGHALAPDDLVRVPSVLPGGRTLLVPTAAAVAEALERLDRARAGVVREWSPKSRARMVETLSSLDYAAIPLLGTPGMVTLTYPGEWRSVAGSGRVVKGHLQAFQKRWERAMGWRLCGVWKLEFQRRGAPHVHLYGPVPALVHARCGEGPHDLAGTCERFEDWLSRTWADVVGADGPSSRCRDEHGQDVACEHERCRHERAGTGVDFGSAEKMSDPARLSIYFLGHSAKTTDGKEYQHVVPPEWQSAETGPGRFWGFWGLERGTAVLDVDGAEWVQLRRVMRRLLAARDRSTAYSRASHAAREAGHRGAARTRVALATMRPRPRRTLGVGGQMTGGFVLVNDGVRLALDLGYLLQLWRGSPPEPSGGFLAWTVAVADPEYVSAFSTRRRA